ncbi:hypothetical protein IEQ34_000382 [Dendrobium chrysotoxum]|uniref:Uncharacterized protein n=1 Tax=Dendrobium chrysotoxum TaxID=161865 RepID=A0AAV7HS93_DENCH|nr:hypothetical protein IEQ34_000382 [Dendrobium chrysotoxum]
MDKAFQGDANLIALKIVANSIESGKDVNGKTCGAREFMCKEEDEFLLNYQPSLDHCMAGKGFELSDDRNFGGVTIKKCLEESIHNLSWTPHLNVVEPHGSAKASSVIRQYEWHASDANRPVRRGADRAEIYSLAFSVNMQWLVVSSDKGTIHVFNLKVNLGLTATDKPRPAPEPNVPAVSSSLSFIKGVLPKYFHSEWSVAQFRLPEGSQYIVAFGHQKNTIVILGMDGRLVYAILFLFFVT